MKGYREFIVLEKREEVHGVVTLTFSSADNTVPHFSAGQYINVYFKESLMSPERAYSISSAPHGETFSLTVRDIGDYSHRLCTLEVGDVLLASLPYGFFYSENQDTDMVLLASGIGVTPFRSMILHTAQHFPSRRISLLHSIRQSDDAIYKAEFDELMRRLPNFSLTHFVTREEITPQERVHNRRLAIADIMENVINLPATEFFICGSISFTRDMRRELIKAGIHEDSVYTETFFPEIEK